MVGRTAFVTLIGIVWLMSVPVYGAPAGERPVIRSAEMAVEDGVVVGDVACDGLFSDQIVGTIQSGLPAVVELLFSLIGRDGKLVGGGLHVFELRYDVWDDYYVVESVDSARRYATFPEMTASMERLRGIAVIPVDRTPADAEFAVKFSIAVHPLRSREKQRIAGWVGDNVGGGSSDAWHEQVLNLNDLIKHFFSREDDSANRSEWYRTDFFNPGRLPVRGEAVR